MELFRLRSGEGTAPYMVLSNIVPLCPFRQINPNSPQLYNRLFLSKGHAVSRGRRPYSSPAGVSSLSVVTVALAGGGAIMYFSMTG